MTGGSEHTSARRQTDGLRRLRALVLMAGALATPLTVHAQGLPVAGLPVAGAAALPQADGVVGGAMTAPMVPSLLDGVSAPVVDPLVGAPAVFRGTDDRERALDCMTAAIAYEAGNQPVAGQQAVAQVILNRMRHPRFPKTVCGVVFSGAERSTGCQFTFTCDGSLKRALRAETFSTARSVALSVIDGLSPDRVHGATHYHADYVLPYWAVQGTAVAKIGAHIFYRMPGDGGPGAGDPVKTSGEPNVVALARITPRMRRQQPVALRSVAPAARALFAPWGLPVNGLAANAPQMGGLQTGELATGGLRRPR